MDQEVKCEVTLGIQQENNVAEIPGLPTNVLSMMTSSNDTSRDLDNSLIKWLYNKGEHVRWMIKKHVPFDDLISDLSWVICSGMKETTIDYLEVKRAD